ncbi:MAG: putative DNA binding domain-containing protein [Clostridia bacterium]|nr:putative DNA binding domain-containing protein [Clostridia bacterium]
MQTEELFTLVKQIQAKKCEEQTIEVKSASGGCPTKLFGTLSSFSNQDNGGIIVFGLDENKDFEVVGVYDPHDIQKKVTEQCKQMEPVIRPLFTACLIDNAVIISAEIPSANPDKRPVFYRGVGRMKGSYVRVGESDELMSEYEIYSYEAFRRRIRDDLRKVENTKLSLLNAKRIESYIDEVKHNRSNLADVASDNDILELMGVTSDGVPTLAGHMAFSLYPQAIFPQLCITAVVVPGNSMGETGEEGERFLANNRITGSIPDMLEDAVDFVRRNGRVKTIIDDEGKRLDKPEFPTKAVREAILNALVHRDYSIHTESVPIRIVMYSNRMEIVNSGGLYGNISIDSLGKVRPDTRNVTLANILELMSITENRYSGIPTIRKEFKKANLPEPVFLVKRGEFIVVFKNTFETENVNFKNKDLPTKLIEFCSVPRTREELIKFTGFSQYYTMSKIIKPLVNEGKIGLTMPDKPKSQYQKYFTLI